MSLLSNIWKHLLFSGSSSAETLLWQKQLIPAPFCLKGISLLLIPQHYFTYQPFHHVCLLLATKLASQKQAYCLWWKLFCYSSLSHLTPETFISPSALCLSFVLFVFVFQLIETTTADLQGFTIELKYRGNLECWMRICAVQNIETMFWRRVYFMYGKKSAVVPAVSQK